MTTAALQQQPRSRARTWTLLGSLLFLCTGAVVFPIIIIRPFTHQAALPLSLALFIRRWAPWVTIIGFLGGVVVAGRGWTTRNEQSVLWKNALLSVAVAGLALCAWASRINVYERIMFRPLGNVSLVPAAKAQVRPDDMVIVVSINGDDRAYPVLQMAYHHVVNDVVGGVPIVSTY